MTWLVLGLWLTMAGPEAEIESLLSTQAEAWNEGDLDAFMQSYWNSPELTFYSGGAITRGWQATLERYQRRYQSEGREMGHLTFSGLKIEMLGEESAFVRGRWRLKLSDGSAPGGLFTLIVRETPNGWRIIHDHTSSE